MQNGINSNATYEYNTTYSNYTYSYYSKNSNAKSKLESWYTANITNKGYADKVATGNYFCEQMKAATTNAAGFTGGSVSQNYILHIQLTSNVQKIKMVLV